MKKILLILILTFSFSKLWANSLEDTLDSLENDVLTNVQENESDVPTSEHGLPVPPTEEGIPGNYLNIDDISEGAFTAADLIDEALEDRLTLPIGERIIFLTTSASQIVQRSGSKPAEMLLRLVLNRSIDTVNAVIPVVGLNTDHIARYLANFMRESFLLAKSYANTHLQTESSGSGIPDMEKFFQSVSVARFGQIYANLIWRYSGELTTDSSKVIILMKLLSYLGGDLNADSRRTTPGIGKSLINVSRLQDSKLYKGIIKTLRDGNEPTQKQTTSLRRQVFDILKKLPKRLQEAGVK